MSGENDIVALNNYLQRMNLLTTLSWQDTTTGPAHAPQWTCICKIRGIERGVGTGAHKHVARNMAAKAALDNLLAEEAS